MPRVAQEVRLAAMKSPRWPLINLPKASVCPKRSCLTHLPDETWPAGQFRHPNQAGTGPDGVQTVLGVGVAAGLAAGTGFDNRSASSTLANRRSHVSRR
jgi:hypothetical protein